MAIAKVAVPGQPLVPEYDVTSIGNLKLKYIPGPGTKLQEIDIEGKTTPVITSTILGKVQLFERAQETAVAVDKSYIIAVVGKGHEYAKLAKDNGETAGDEMDVDELTPIPISPEDEKKLVNRANSNLLPQENDVVLCRVIRISSKQASVEIIAVEDKGLIIKDSGIDANEISQNASGSVYASVATTSLNNNASDIGENFKGIIRIQDIRSTERDKVKVYESFRPGDVIRAVIISKGDGSNYYLSTAANDLGVVFAKAKGGEGEVMYAIDWESMVEPSTGDIELRKCAKTF